MLTLYYTPGACSMAAHIVLEESSEHYEGKKVDLAGGEQRTEAYLKINPLGRVPALLLDNGEPLAENTAILPFLDDRFHETTQLHFGPSIYGMRPFRTSHMIRTLETPD
jgi:glutathione S-transferase